jgi:hypothetical protein
MWEAGTFDIPAQHEETNMIRADKMISVEGLKDRQSDYQVARFRELELVKKRHGIFSLTVKGKKELVIA